MPDIGTDLYLAYEDGHEAGKKDATPKWISVNERLPHAIAGESDDVLTLNRFGEYNILYFDGNKWRKRNGEQYTLNPLFEVVYWMLPGAPDGFRPWRGT